MKRSLLALLIVGVFASQVFAATSLFGTDSTMLNSLNLNNLSQLSMSTGGLGNSINLPQTSDTTKNSSNLFATQGITDVAENISPQYLMKPLDPQKYYLGPGDVLGIYIWGKVAQSFQVGILPENKTYVPLIGTINTKNKSLYNFRREVIRKLARYYPNAQIDVLLNSIKSISVRLSGQTKKPGLNLIKDGTTISQLIMGTGIFPSGSYRHISIKRGGRRLTVDLYDVFLRGKSDLDLNVHNGDEIFIPVKKNYIKMGDNLVEIKKGETMQDVLNMYSGTLNSLELFFGQAYLMRKDSKGLAKKIAKIELQDLFSDEATIESIALLRGDEIMIPESSKKVYVLGQVNTPGSYPYASGATLYDYITRAGGFNGRDAKSNIAIIRNVDGKDKVIKLKLNADNLIRRGKIRDSEDIQAGDVIFVPQSWFANWNDLLGILGVVRNSMYMPRSLKDAYNDMININK